MFLKKGRFLLVTLTLWAASATEEGALARSHRGRHQQREKGDMDAPQLFDRGDFAGAARAYEAEYQRTRNPDLFYWLGKTAKADGRLLDAQNLLGRYLGESVADGPSSAIPKALMRTEAEQIVKLPQPPSGKVSIVGARGTLVWVDGRLLGELPLSRSLLCAPGKRKLLLVDKKRQQQEVIEIAEGRFVEVTYDRGSASLISAELPGVLVAEQYDGAAPAWGPTISQAVEDGLQGERLSPYPLGLALKRAGGDAGPCAEAACRVKLARQNELDYVLAVQLKQDAGKAPVLRMQLIDVEVGEESARSEKECTAGSAENAAELLRSELPRLLAAAQKKERGELRVSSNPAGAEVRAGGQVLGTTPLVKAAWAGPLAVEVALAGYEPQRTSVVVVAGKKAAVEVTLRAEAEPAPAPLRTAEPPVIAGRIENPGTLPVLGAHRLIREPGREAGGRPRWRLVLGGTALVAGVLLSGFGISALAVADRCVMDPVLPVEKCRTHFGTTPIGAGLLSAGLVVGIGGSILLAIPGSRAR